MKMAPKKSTTKKKSTNEKGNIIDIIVIGLETIATIIKQSKKLWQAPDFGYAPPNISFEPNCHRKVA